MQEILRKDSVNPKLAPKDRKVKQLQQQIDAGKYKPDSKKIAGKMVDRELKEKMTFNKSGQWSLEKMSAYGPKGGGQYSPTDNMKRKKTRTSEEREAAGSNKAVRQYTTSGSKMSDTRFNNLQRQNKKQPVQNFKDMSPEKKAEMKRLYETKKADVEKVAAYGAGSAGVAPAGVAMSEDKD